MTKNILLTVLILSFVLSACSISLPVPGSDIAGSGAVKDESREVNGIQAVRLAGIGDLTIIQGDEESLVISAEENLLPYIETKVEGTTLTIGIKDNRILTPTKSIRYTLKVRDLENIQLSGLGNITMKSLDTETLSALISGSGSLKLENLTASTLDVDISGLGDITMGGEVTSLNGKISGSGNLSLEELSSQSADVRLSGLGSAKVRAADTLNVEISGAGSLEYYGSPTVSSRISGLGSLKQVGE